MRGCSHWGSGSGGGLAIKQSVFKFFSAAVPPPSLLVLFLHQSACLLYLAKFAYILIHKILYFSVLTFSFTKKLSLDLKYVIGAIV